MSEPSEIATILDPSPDVWTAEAVAGLVGQRPIIGRMSEPVARAEIVAATLHPDGRVEVTMRLPGGHAAVVGRLEPEPGAPQPYSVGFGYQVNRLEAPEAVREGRWVAGVRLHEVDRPVLPPAERAPADRAVLEAGAAAAEQPEQP